MLFEFPFHGFYFLLPLEFFLAKGFTGLQLIILHPDSEEGSAFPAPIRSLIARVSQRKTTVGIALGTFDFDYHNLNLTIAYVTG